MSRALESTCVETLRDYGIQDRGLTDLVSCNVYGRLAVFLEKAEAGNDDAARSELLALLKFFPKRRRA